MPTSATRTVDRNRASFRGGPNIRVRMRNKTKGASRIKVAVPNQPLRFPSRSVVIATMLSASQAVPHSEQMSESSVIGYPHRGHFHRESSATSSRATMLNAATWIAATPPNITASNSPSSAGAPAGSFKHAIPRT